MKHAIITGATGCIGMALIEQCLENNIEVTVLAHKGSARNANIPAGEHVRLVEWDLLPDVDSDILRKDGAMAQLPETCDYFFHLAWGGTIGPLREDATVQEENVQHTLAAVELAKHLGCTAFIGVGSQAEYGRVEGILRPDTPCHPETEYGKCKLLAGEKSRELCRQYGMRHEWCRVLSTYGPFDGPDTLISYLIETLLKGEKPQVTPGEQIWDYAFSEDIAAGILGAALGGRDGAVYVLGSESVRRLRDYMETLRTELGRVLAEKKKSDILPMGELPVIQYGAKDYPIGQVMHLEADISAAEKDYGFAPTVDFSLGIRKTILWRLYGRTK